jgi:hypothetical protein
MKAKVTSRVMTFIPGFMKIEKCTPNLSGSEADRPALT